MPIQRWRRWIGGVLIVGGTLVVMLGCGGDDGGPTSTSISGAWLYSDERPTLTVGGGLTGLCTKRGRMDITQSAEVVQGRLAAHIICATSGGVGSTDAVLDVIGTIQDGGAVQFMLSGTTELVGVWRHEGLWLADDGAGVILRVFTGDTVGSWQAEPWIDSQ